MSDDMILRDRMTNFGLSKLAEELGECGQVIGKMLQFPELMMSRHYSHPDGKGDLPTRLEDELGDVLGAMHFVVERMGLDGPAIFARAERKKALFWKWDDGDAKTAAPVVDR